MPGSVPPPPPSPPPSSPKSERPSFRPSLRVGGAQSLLGTEIGGRYRLDSILGEGGMGTVYAAEHMLMRKRVALKVLHPDMGKNPDIVARFEREAMAAGHIDHPNIAAATDFGQLADGSFFLVLEFVEGENLREVIARGRLDIDRATHIGTQIASALARAHSLGVVHRDLKPDNVMLITRGPDPDFVKVLDFGIAKVPILELGAPPPPSLASTPSSGSPRVLTQIGMIYGTPEYMAPEQALGQPVDGRADLYAVGILLFEMLTGKRPFDHENLAVLLGLHVTAVVPAMAELAPEALVPPALEAVVRRLLAKDPAQRFATAAELEDALRQASPEAAPTQPLSQVFPPSSVADMRSPFASGASLHGAVATPAPNVRRVVGLSALGVVAVAALALFLFLRPHAKPATDEGDGGGTSNGSSGGNGSSVAGIPSSPASRRTDVPPRKGSVPPDPLAAVIAAADASLAKNDPASVILAIAPLEAANASRSDVHRLLERAYALSHDRSSALREADAWLTLDASASADLALQADIGEIATRPALSDAAIALLANKMSTPGVDILYDLVYASHQAPSVARRARSALDEPQVRAHAGPSAAILLDLRDAPTCEAKRALLPRAKSDGDRRVIAVLQPLMGGKAGACMRGDPDLAETIAAVRGRTGML